MSSTIRINNISYSGSSIVINNGKVIIDGKEVQTDDKQISIVVEGHVGKLEVDCCNSLEIKGAAGSVKTTSGSVRCGAVTGSVSTMSGSVNCGDIGGDVSTMSGSVNCKGHN